MARMSIDDKFLRDPRVTRLAKACGWSVREARGCLLDVYAICYDRADDVLVDTDIDTAADRDGFGALMAAADLAEPMRGGRKFRIKGARDGVKYLVDKQEAGRVGGLKSGETRREKRSNASKQPKQGFPEIEAAGNPLVPDLAPDLPLAPVPDLAPDPVPDLPEGDRFALAPTPARKPAAPKPPVPGQQETVAAFHAAYLAQNGVAPTWGAKQAGQIKQLVTAHGADEVQRRIAVLFEGRGPAFLSGPFDVGTLVQHFDKLARPSARASPGREPQGSTQIALSVLAQLEAEEAERNRS